MCWTGGDSSGEWIPSAEIGFNEFVWYGVAKKNRWLSDISIFPIKIIQINNNNNINDNNNNNSEVIIIYKKFNV